ncbi:MAG: penicillin-binding transpeptidase domain-containing protein, partial [Bdellovibrionales bacterium]|nr:penicillin-binding transpeptidase domain-containing protein [Bdellovibrionales bacterium]
YSIFAIPKYFEDKNQTLEKFSKIVPKYKLWKLKKKLKNRDRYTWIARKIVLKDDQVEAIKKLRGLYIEAVPKRFYPNKELLAQTLGFVGLDNVGLSGVEYIFDKELRGEEKIVKYLRDAKGRPIKIEVEKDKKSSQDVNLSIDKDLQAISEKALREAVNFYKAEKGGVGVIDPQTGEILAIANYPSFDPNNFRKSKAKDRKLSFISDPFEPGSVSKIFTVASALEFKIAKSDTNYYCERGQLKIGNHIINEAEASKKNEWLSVSEIIEYSSNIGTTKIAFDLTFPRLKKTLLDFNFGQKTGIEIPGESRGIFDADENVSPLKLSNISFGQGIATTGLQVLAAYAAIANGGIYYQPTLLKTDSPKKGIRVLSHETSEELVKMLVGAVENGTGKNAKIPYFKIAGKTSTAQKPTKEGGYKGYIPGFVGFPVGSNKHFVVYVYIDGPQGRDYYGNTVAAPVFKKIAEYILYKEKDLHQLSIRPENISKGNMDLVKIKESSTRFYSRGEVPNFIGLDKVSTARLAQKLKLKINEQGIGVVTGQNPLPKTKLNNDTVVNLIYSPPNYE